MEHSDYLKTAISPIDLHKLTSKCSMITKCNFLQKVKYLFISLYIVLISSNLHALQEEFSSSEQVIRNLYENFGQVWCSEKELPKYFTSTLVKEIAKVCATDLVGEIGCPIIPGNDYDEKEIIQTLKVGCIKKANPTCKVTFKNFGFLHTVTYSLQEHAQRYLITDIIDEQGVSYRRNLSEALK